MLNHSMESNIDFKVAHQIDPIRGLFAVINYGDFSAQVCFCQIEQWYNGVIHEYSVIFFTSFTGFKTKLNRTDK